MPPQKLKIFPLSQMYFLYIRTCTNVMCYPAKLRWASDLSWIHQEYAQMGRNKWFKKDMKENNRKGKIMMTASLEAIRKQSDFCLWRKEGYLQHEEEALDVFSEQLPPCCSHSLGRAGRADYRPVTHTMGCESEAWHYWSKPAPLWGTQALPSSQLPCCDPRPPGTLDHSRRGGLQPWVRNRWAPQSIWSRSA